MPLLSVVVPMYNEANTATTILEKLLSVNLIGSFEMEILIVDDGSSDGTKRIVREFIEEHPEQNLRHYIQPKNMGKGAALHRGIAESRGDWLVIQDADLEYDPDEFNLLLEPVIRGFADVVYGSRFSGGNAHRALFFWHTIGNKWLTLLSNIFNNLNLTDMETCYKLFRGDLIRGLNLEEKRFGFEPEVTAKIARADLRIYEVGISYYGRSYKEGKKISWKDGIRAIWVIFKYGLFVR